MIIIIIIIIIIIMKIINRDCHLGEIEHTGKLVYDGLNGTKEIAYVSVCHI